MRTTLTFLLITSSLCAVANPFVGFYGGAELGGSFTSSNMETQSTSLVDFNPSGALFAFHVKEGVNAGTAAPIGALFLGYGFGWENFYLGTEIFGSLSHTTIEDSNDVSYVDPTFESDHTHIKRQLSLSAIEGGLDLRPGYLLKPNTLLYARLGVAINQLTSEIEATTADVFSGVGVIPESFSSHAQNSDNQITTGWRLGAGIEQYITEHLTLRADYIYTYYGNIEVSASNSEAVGFSSNLASNGIISIFPSGSATVSNNVGMIGLSYYLDENKNAHTLFPSDFGTSEYPFNGFFIGANIGETFAQAQTNVNSNSISFFDTIFFPVTSEIPLGANIDLNQNQFTGGFYAGYGYSWHNWYLGAQVFADYENIQVTNADNGGISTYGGIVLEEGLNTLSHVKATMNPVEYGVDVLPGYILTPDMLIYARIGAAFNEITIETRTEGTLEFFPPLLVSEFFSVNANSSESEKVTGLRLGAGMEIGLGRHFSLRGDYIYTYYPSVNSQVSNTVPVNAINNPILGSGTFTATNDTEVQFTNNTLLVGLTYYFDVATF